MAADAVPAAVSPSPPESAGRLAALLDNLPGMAYRCRHDEHWTMEYVSAGSRELTGYAPADLCGNRTISFERVIHPEDRGRVRAGVEAALARGGRFALVYRLVTAGGAVRWVQEHGLGVGPAGTGPRCIEGFVTDITERQAADEALARNERLLAAVLDHTFQYIGVLDPAGRLLRPNQTSLDAIGARREEVEGRFFWETPWWAHAPEEQQRLRAAVERAAQGEFVRFETSHPAADGRVLTIDFSLKPVRDDAGRVILLIPEGRDISEQRAAREARRESEEQFATAFQLSPYAMSIASLADGRYLEINQGHEALFGYPRAEIIGRTPAEIGLLVDPAVTAAALQELQATGRVRDLTVTVRTRGGELRTVVNNAALIRVGGRDCALLTSRDITGRLRAEQALQESEDKFARAFRASPDAISISERATGRLIEVNEGFERLSGYPRADLIGRTAADLGLWAVPGERDRLAAELARAGAVRNLPMRVQNRRGEQGEFLVSAEAVEIGGRPCLVVVAHDISDRLRQEQALRESEEKFAKAFQVSPDIMAITDFATGRYVEVNEAHERLFGFSREETLGRSPAELGLLPDPGLREEMVRVLERDGRVRNFRVEARNRRGEPVILLLSAERIRVGGRDCVLRCSHDITEQVRAEQALRESEDKFAKAFLASPQPLVITEMATGRYIDVNRGFEQVTGYRRDEVIGRTSLEVGIWDSLADRAELFRRLEQDGQARDLELVFRRKDGGRVITRCSFECIDLAGRRCMLSAIEDITERRQADERKAEVEAQMRQTQKLEALGTLAGGIAHDFNNILTAIIVNQELAVMDLHEPADLRRRLAEIGAASGRAKELVRQILTFSRQQPHERLRQHLQMIVREALGLLRASLPATIEIIQEISPQAPPVLADASQIHQVLMNLCTNAAHAMRGGPGRLTVRLAPRLLDEAACRALPGLRPGPHAQLTVADTGHGMDAAVLARIFEPFFTTKGPGEGTGLGLAMVHGIIRDHGGAIGVQSRPGGGTTFELYLPESGDAAGTVAATEAAIVPGHGEAVLVVDDEEAIGLAVGAMLRRIGYRVQTFADPRLALEQFRATPAEFHLLLTDRTMPHLSGPEVIARARDARPGLPALMMSGLSSSPAEEREAREGRYALVAKPIDIADLSCAVRKALAPFEAST